MTTNPSRNTIVGAAFAGLLAGMVPGIYAVMHKPAPTVIQPQTVVVARGDKAADLTKAEKRHAAASWGELDQKEVDAITAALRSIPKGDKPLTIFCKDDMKCGDMQLNFTNAFNSARWDTLEETPLIDDTVGIATTREDLRKAINEATSGRLNVRLVGRNADFDFLVIGAKKPG